MQTPSAIASTGIATMPKINARGSAATHSVNGVGRGSSRFAVMGRSPIRSHQSLNVDLILLFFATLASDGLRPKATFTALVSFVKVVVRSRDLGGRTMTATEKILLAWTLMSIIVLLAMMRVTGR
jgi:hypothetical protein